MTDAAETLVVISAPHFVAGVCLRDDKAVRVPPILNYMLGWSRLEIERYAGRKGWKYCDDREAEIDVGSG